MITISEAAVRASTTRERVYDAIKRGDLTLIINKPRMKLLDARQVDTWGSKPKDKGGRPRKQNEASG